MFYWRYTTHSLNFLLCTKSGVTDNSEEPKLIISLTSYPARYHLIHLTLVSLLLQSQKPDQIILWLSDQQKPEEKYLKKWDRLVKRGLSIKYATGDVRSYKKLIYTAQEFPKATIITVDDETMYPRHLVETLYNKHLEYPQSIVGTRCTYMTKVGENEIAPYRSWQESSEIKPSYNNFVTGVGGVLYPAQSLHKDLYNIEAFTKLAPNADDIWFKAMGLRNNIKTVPAHIKESQLVFSKRSQEDALWHTNVTKDENSEQLKNVFDKYNLYKYIN